MYLNHQRKYLNSVFGILLFLLMGCGGSQGSTVIARDQMQLPVRVSDESTQSAFFQFKEPVGAIASNFDMQYLPRSQHSSCAGLSREVAGCLIYSVPESKNNPNRDIYVLIARKKGSREWTISKDIVKLGESYVQAATEAVSALSVGAYEVQERVLLAASYDASTRHFHDHAANPPRLMTDYSATFFVKVPYVNVECLKKHALEKREPQAGDFEDFAWIKRDALVRELARNNASIFTLAYGEHSARTFLIDHISALALKKAQDDACMAKPRKEILTHLR